MPAEGHAAPPAPQSLADRASKTPDASVRRRTLWLVAGLNVGLAIGCFVGGAAGDSIALIANGLDEASGALVHVLGLFAMSRTRAWKTHAARFSGATLLVFAVGVAVDVGRRVVYGSEPIGVAMMAMAAVAATVNIVSWLLLKRPEDKGANLRTATPFIFSDLAASGGILVGGAIVWWTDDNWPDLLVGVAVAGFAVTGALRILRDAHEDPLIGVSTADVASR